MEPIIMNRILSGLSYAQIEAHESAVRYGYWEKQRSMAEAIALIHRDASRALEAVTVGDGPSAKIKDCSRLEEHLADIIIRCLDISAGKALRVPAAVLAKMQYNEEHSKLLKKDF